MADKQKAALNRLSKKLSALRATLSRDERILLDRIVLGTNEVVGHKMTTNAASSSRNRAVSAKGSKKVSEVAMHGMTTGAASGARAVKKVSEVSAHGMTTGAASGAKAAQAAQGAVSVAQAAASSAANVGALFEFDATTGGYRVTGGAQI